MALVLDAETGLPDPTPRDRPDGGPDSATLPLRSGVDVRREMAKIYREAKGGKRDAADAAKLVWMLAEIRKCIELEEIERRLAALESAKALPGSR